MKIVLLLSALVILTQCQTKQEGSHATYVNVNGNKMIDCNISDVTDTVDFPLSRIIAKCEMIQLETIKESLFKSVYHVGISDNFIAIHSRGQMPIKLFNRQGKFIRDIGTIGRGPGEFTSLYGIQLDEQANKLYLTPFAHAQKLIVYSLDNENLPDIPLVYKQTKCCAYVNGDIVTVLSMPFKIKDVEPIPIACQQTTDGKLIQKIKTPEHLAINPFNEKGQFGGFNSELSSSHNAGAFDIYTFTWGNKGYDTLYHYDVKANRLVPKYVASFTGKKHGSWTYEWKSYYYTWLFGDKYKGAKVIVDKKTLKSAFFNVINDFYGDIELKKFFMSNNGMFIGAMSAFELIKAFDEALKNGDLSNKERKKIETLRKSLHEDDNEILFVGKML